MSCHVFKYFGKSLLVLSINYQNVTLLNLIQIFIEENSQQCSNVCKVINFCSCALEVQSKNVLQINRKLRLLIIFC